MDITPAAPADLDSVRALLREYAASLGTHICFQTFDRELADLPGDYAPPGGRLLVARDGDALTGCVALRPLPGVGGELKRLYVRPAARGTGLGRRLARHVIDEAAAIGYGRLFLDTLPTMTEAAGLYRSLGFRPVAPYLADPVPGAVCMALDLRPAGVTTGSPI
jgi:ribosomal protein S18 acetylase RimI-like enzyme